MSTSENSEQLWGGELLVELRRLHGNNTDSLDEARLLGIWELLSRHGVILEEPAEGQRRTDLVVSVLTGEFTPSFREPPQVNVAADEIIPADFTEHQPESTPTLPSRAVVEGTVGGVAPEGSIAAPPIHSLGVRDDVGGAAIGARTATPRPRGSGGSPPPGRAPLPENQESPRGVEPAVAELRARLEEERSRLESASQMAEAERLQAEIERTHEGGSCAAGNRDLKRID